MQLTYPFHISSRLAPAVKVADAVLSFDNGRFVLDFPDGSEYTIEDFNFPRCRIAGDTDESVLQDGFRAVLSFLCACAESRSYAERHSRDPMDGENSDLFPEHIGMWAQQHSDEIGLAQLEIEETPGAIAAS